MTRMFASSDFVGGVGSWDVSQVTEIEGIFADCIDFRDFDISGWELNAESLYGMVSTMCCCRESLSFRCLSSSTTYCL